MNICECITRYHKKPGELLVYRGLTSLMEVYEYQMFLHATLFNKKDEKSPPVYRSLTGAIESTKSWIDRMLFDESNVDDKLKKWRECYQRTVIQLRRIHHTVDDGALHDFVISWVAVQALSKCIAAKKIEIDHTGLTIKSWGS